MTEARIVSWLVDTVVNEFRYHIKFGFLKVHGYIARRPHYQDFGRIRHPALVLPLSEEDHA